MLYSVRSERMLMEQLDYNLLFRWFVRLNVDDAIWDITVDERTTRHAGYQLSQKKRKRIEDLPDRLVDIMNVCSIEVDICGVAIKSNSGGNSACLREDVRPETGGMNYSM